MAKCSAPGCSNFKLNDDNDKIQCNGFCKKYHHGFCIGLSRSWNVAPSTSLLTLMRHFTCSACLQLPDMLTQFDSLWTEKFDDLLDTVKQQHSDLKKRTAKSDDAFNELSANFASLSELLCNIEELFLTNQQKSTVEKSLMFDLISKPTTTTATQTEAAPVSRHSKADESNNESNNVNGWRTINGKRIWRPDWTIHDKNVAKKSSTVIPKPKKKPLKKTLQKQTRVTKKMPSDNFFNVLGEFQHLEPPVYDHHHKNRNNSKNQPRNRQNLTRHNSSQRSAQKSFINFVPGPVLNPIIP